jgi:hypothetical protein
VGMIIRVCPGLTLRVLDKRSNKKLFNLLNFSMGAWGRPVMTTQLLKSVLRTGGGALMSSLGDSLESLVSLCLDMVGENKRNREREREREGMIGKGSNEIV